MDPAVRAVLGVCMRWIHIASVVTLIGGFIYARFVLAPALASVAPTRSATLVGDARGRRLPAAAVSPSWSRFSARASTTTPPRPAIRRTITCGSESSCCSCCIFSPSAILYSVRDVERSQAQSHGARDRNLRLDRDRDFGLPEVSVARNDRLRRTPERGRPGWISRRAAKSNSPARIARACCTR